MAQALATSHELPVRSPFDTDVARVVGELRAALTGVISALAKPIRGGTDLQRELGLPSTLSWQLHGFISAQDPTAAAAQIPGRQAFNRALAAARAKGVAQEILDRADTAFREFEACVKRHTGSRAAFTSMVTSRPTADSFALDLKARRDAFRASSHIYGVHMDAHVATAILHPGTNPNRLDYVFINGWIGLQVIRPFEKLFVSRHFSRPDDPSIAPTRALPIDAPDDAIGSPDVPILSLFSSVPQARFHSEPAENEQWEIYVSGQPVGRTGSLSFFLANLWPAATPRHEQLCFECTPIYPMERVVHNILLAPGVAERVAAPATAVYGGALHEFRRKQREVDRLNVPAQSTFAGVGVNSLQTSITPRYVEMLGYVCSRLGWDPDCFDTYRYEVEYPVLHSLMCVKFPAPDRPQGSE
jgi:hypothetical protein